MTRTEIDGLRAAAAQGQDYFDRALIAWIIDATAAKGREESSFGDLVKEIGPPVCTVSVGAAGSWNVGTGNEVVQVDDTQPEPKPRRARLRLCRCRRCGHVWQPRSRRRPRVCPASGCHSAWWDQPRRRF